ncbi:MAG: hypothetical protein OEO83_04830 [Alphaproteobacteria bacterium]|nr:hypothetical protein [Alphaproteobacteria bacterium]
MSATPSEFSSARGLGRDRAQSARDTELRKWTARNTLMFLVGATGLIWTGVIIGAIRFL